MPPTTPPPVPYDLADVLAVFHRLAQEQENAQQATRSLQAQGHGAIAAQFIVNLAVTLGQGLQELDKGSATRSAIAGRLIRDGMRPEHVAEALQQADALWQNPVGPNGEMSPDAIAQLAAQYGVNVKKTVSALALSRVVLTALAEGYEIPAIAAEVQANTHMPQVHADAFVRQVQVSHKVAMYVAADVDAKVAIEQAMAECDGAQPIPLMVDVYVAELRAAVQDDAKGK